MSAGILANPLMQMFLAQAGGEVLSRLMPSSQSPYQQAIGQQMAYGQKLMPEIYSQAMGKPGAATQQAYRNLSAEANRLQQSYGASAQRATPTMREPVTPVREQQARYGEAKLKGYADILSQGQINAQNAIMGAYGQGLAGQQALEMQNRADRSNMFRGLSGIINEYRMLKQDEQARALFEPLLKRIMVLLGGGGQGSANLLNAGDQQGWSPMPAWTPTYDERYL